MLLITLIKLFNLLKQKITIASLSIDIYTEFTIISNLNFKANNITLRTYHINELRQFQLYRYTENITSIHHGSDELVVTG